LLTISIDAIKDWVNKLKKKTQLIIFNWVIFKLPETFLKSTNEIAEIIKEIIK